MKKCLRFVSFFLVFMIVAAAAVTLIPDQFPSAYQRAIVYQYDYYRTLGDHKIVLIGGSSLSFGIDLDLMEELTGRPCAILGNHAGYGLSYMIEMSKSNLQDGDIVVIEFANYTLDDCGTELLLTGMGKRYDMYRFLHPRVWGQIIEAYPSYIKKSVGYWLGEGYQAPEPYTMESYDNRGAMVLQRDGCSIPEPFTDEVAKIYNRRTYGPSVMNGDFQEYLSDYVAYCKERNVQVYFTTVYWLDEAVLSNPDDIAAYDASLREQLAAPMISDSRDLIFPRKYIYNAIAHCNTEGAKYRTTLLYEDLEPYLAN